MHPMVIPRSLLLALILLLPVVATPNPLDLPRPGPDDTCPVCGMFVAKYPDWVATVHYQDGHAHHFDGAKDLFKYLLDMSTWAPNDRIEAIGAIGVTEYYGLSLIDARQAFFVIGSDVLGPMGHELIPLQTEEDAAEFLRDHKGTKIIRFNQVTMALLLKLDQGVFD